MSQKYPSLTPLKRPLSPAVRERLYQRRLRRATRSVSVVVSERWINGLLQLGYLGENEIEDERAIEQALSIFVWEQCARTAPIRD